MIDAINNVFQSFWLLADEPLVLVSASPYSNIIDIFIYIRESIINNIFSYLKTSMRT